jgi:hypothetical protein
LLFAYDSNTTASYKAARVTNDIINSVLEAGEFSALKDFTKVSYIQDGADCDGRIQEFGIQIANDAFKSDLAEGANRAAIQFMHAVRARGVAVSAGFFVFQTNGAFHRRQLIYTDFSDSAKKITNIRNMIESPMFTPGGLRSQEPKEPEPEQWPWWNPEPKWAKEDRLRIERGEPPPYSMGD